MATTTDEKTIELANGQHIDVRLAVGCFEHLRNDLEFNPEEFQALVAFAQGRPMQGAEGIFQEMRQAGMILKDDSVNPLYKAILQCSLQESDGRLQMVPPYRQGSVEDKRKWDAEMHHFKKQLVAVYDTALKSPSPRGRKR